MPSSADIENFINKLANEYIDVIIPKDILEELNDALNKKFNNNNSTKLISENNSESKISSIPLPPEKKGRGAKDD